MCCLQLNGSRSSYSNATELQSDDNEARKQENADGVDGYTQMIEK
jgi:hypothetical protein